MKASGIGRLWYVEELLKLGADPSLRDSDGKTAMDYASQLEQDEVVELLEASY